MRTAAYARYSSDQQRAASIEDQLRNIRARCAREGWPEPAVYADAAISGARSDRPAYQRLLADSAQYQVLLVDDLSRLGRDQAELAGAVKRLRFSGVRVVGVSDGVDTARKGHQVDVGLRSLMGELYLANLAEKTHRGLTGRALAGSSAGGLPYGYQVTATGQRAIRDDQAAIVRRIFADYLSGHSPRAIAAALNAARVPSPRGSTWAASAIHGDARRGIGILVNPIYTGQQIWNRSRWIKHPDTGRRVRQERPRDEWIITEQPELAIISAEQWHAAQRAIAARGIRQPARPGGPGRAPRHLLSGILRCATCGGPLVVVDRYRYGCATHKQRGPAACPSTLHVSIAAADRALLGHVRSALLDPAALTRFAAAARAALKRHAPDAAAARRALADAERTRDNILAAIRAGILTPSTRAELIAAEASIADAEHRISTQRDTAPAHILPRARERLQRLADQLADVARDNAQARQALRACIGDRIPVHENGGDPYAEIAAAESQMVLVAGACSAHYLTVPARVYLRCES